MRCVRRQLPLPPFQRRHNRVLLQKLLLPSPATWTKTPRSVPADPGRGSVPNHASGHSTDRFLRHTDEYDILPSAPVAAASPSAFPRHLRRPRRLRRCQTRSLSRFTSILLWLAAKAILQVPTTVTTLTSPKWQRHLPLCDGPRRPCHCDCQRSCRASCHLRRPRCRAARLFHYRRHSRHRLLPR
jgi:hypothetical protein